MTARLGPPIGCLIRLRRECPTGAYALFQPGRDPCPMILMTNISCGCGRGSLWPSRPRDTPSSTSSVRRRERRRGRRAYSDSSSTWHCPLACAPSRRGLGLRSGAVARTLGEYSPQDPSGREAWAALWVGGKSPDCRSAGISDLPVPPRHVEATPEYKRRVPRVDNSSRVHPLTG